MARPSFRDRFFTPPVARAMLSPSGILLAGAGAAVAIATGLPLLVAPVAAVAAWGARVAAAIPKAPSRGRIDPFALGEPWRRYVQDALDARSRFDVAVQETQGGPLRDRLGEIGARLDDAVEECWRIARRGHQMVLARRAIDADEARRQLSQVQHDAAQPWAKGSSIERTVEALTAQIETARRMEHVVADAQDRLRLLDARLDETVARSIELSVQADDAAALSSIGADVDGLVSEMEALRQALEDTGGGTTIAGTT